MNTTDIIRSAMLTHQGQTWFRASTIAALLGHRDARAMTKTLPDWTVSLAEIDLEGQRGHNKVSVINAAGLIAAAGKTKRSADSIQQALGALLMAGLTTSESKSEDLGLTTSEGKSEDPALTTSESEGEDLGLTTSETEGEDLGLTTSESESESEDPALTTSEGTLPFNLPEVASLKHNNNGMYRSLVEAYNRIIDQGVGLPDHLAPWNWIEAHVPQLHDIAERERLPSALELASFSTMHKSAWARDDVAQMYLDDIKTWGLSASSN